MTTVFIKTDVSSYTWDGSTLTNVTDADYPNPTVPGVAYLNGRVYVMEADGTISHSDEDNFTSWNALNFVTAAYEPDAGVCLARSQEYIVAFGSYTTEFFYDAQNPTGAVITAVPNQTLMIGCSAANSVQQIEGGLIWLAQQRGLGGSVQLKKFVAILVGLQYKKVSTEDIDRILIEQDDTNVTAAVITIAGHEFYVLCFQNNDLSLVYDISQNHWAQWTLGTISTQAVSTISQSGGLATVQHDGHGYSDGDPVTIGGASPSGYNGSFNINVLDASTFTYPVAFNTSSPGSGTISVSSWVYGIFDVAASCKFANNQLIQARGDSTIYTIDLSNVTDQGSPIYSLIRTPIYDGGSNSWKHQTDFTVIGDQVSSQVLVRWSDDDYRSFRNYRTINLNSDRPHASRGGAFRRRSYDLLHTSTVQARFSDIEIDIKR